MERVDRRPLSYVERLDRRSPDEIRRVVIHATELPDLATAREYAERIHYADSRTGNAGHFYIDRDGAVELWVPLDRIAHHVRDHNADSIGIELVHIGRWPDWLASGSQEWTEPFTDAQIRSLIELLRALQAELPSLETVTGHDRLDTRRVPASDDPAIRVRRKLDPGPTFPWSRVLDAVDLVGLARRGLREFDAADGVLDAQQPVRPSAVDEGGARARLALQGDLTSDLLDQPVHHRKAQTGALGRADDHRRRPQFGHRGPYGVEVCLVDRLLATRALALGLQFLHPLANTFQDLRAGFSEA